MSKPRSYDHLFKLLLIGDSSVGKTCLIVKYVDDDFNNTFISTIGIDFKIKSINLGGKVIKLQIWDTAGQERFRTITASYYRGAMGILLVYSISQRASFENVTTWMKAISQHASEDVQRILVGNKADMDSQREVSTEEGEILAKSHEALFIETSAKTGQNVREAFERLSLQIMAIKPTNPPIESKANTANLSPGNKSPLNTYCSC